MLLTTIAEWKRILKHMHSINENRLTKFIVTMATPIALQNLINFSVNMVGTFMLGQLGEKPLTAFSLANQVFFILSMVIYGIGEGANVLVAQYWGRKDTNSIHKVMTCAYSIAIGFSTLLCLAALLIPEEVMGIFIKDRTVIGLGAEYLRVIAVSYLFYAVTAVTTCVLRAVNTVMISMLLSTCTLCINLILSYTLIFGSFGAPRLGITGAAIGTMVSRIAEFIILLLYLTLSEDKLRLRLRKLLKLDKRIAMAYLTFSIPVILNELFWALGMSVVAMILGRMGSEVVAANSIYASVSDFSSSLFSGINSCAGVLVGNAIGAHDYPRMEELKKRFKRISFIAGLIGAFVMLISSSVVVDWYQVNDLTKSYAGKIMLVGAVFELFRAMQTMNMMGILRGGGDVKFTMANDLIFLWGFSIPLGLLAGLVWNWPIAAVYLVLKFDQAIKKGTSEWRLKSGKWMKDVTTAES